MTKMSGTLLASYRGLNRLMKAEVLLDFPADGCRISRGSGKPSELKHLFQAAAGK
jgi:hypothetical protein